MKTRTTYILMLLFAVLISVPSEMAAQNSFTAASAFSVNIEMDGDNVTLKCTQGCNWDKISVKNENTAIDTNGIVETKDSGRASLFIIDVKKTATGITLNGIKGTQWKTPIVIDCKKACKMAVNQNGLLH